MMHHLCIGGRLHGLWVEASFPLPGYVLEPNDDGVWCYIHNEVEGQ